MADKPKPETSQPEKPQRAADPDHDDADRFPAVDTTLPLPTDHPDSDGDSTLGNAPAAPADFVITRPENVQVSGHDDKSGKGE